MLAVAMNTVAQVGGGAEILCGAEGGHVSVGEDGVLGVERSRAFALVLALLLALALPSPLLIFTGM